MTACAHAWSWSSDDGERVRCHRCGAVREVADDVSRGTCAVCGRDVRDALYVVWRIDGQARPVHDLCAEAAS